LKQTAQVGRKTAEAVI